MAKAVIDATGEADVARRAGASMLYPKQEYSEVDGHSPTGMGIHFVVGGVDWDAYQASLTGVDVSDDDMAWAERQVRDQQLLKVFHGLIPGLRLENEKSGYLFETSVTLEGTRVGITMPSLSPTRMPGVLQGRTSIERLEVIDAGNGDHMAILEAAVRRHIFESFSFIKRNAGGFENASLLCIAPFLGSRGGPSIEGDYILTMDDCREGKLFDDVLLRYGEFRALRYTSEQGEPKWVDVPYRVFLPKRIEGLLAVGRAASGQPDTLLRNRMAAKVMGQAVGTAAAMAADEGLTPRALDVRRLQETLLDDGFHLGDRCRLRELCFP